MVKNKIITAIGVLILTIGIIALFPLEITMNEDVPGKIIFSFSGILLGILLILYGFFKSNFLKAVAIVVASVFLSILFWYLYYGGKWGDQIVMFWVGVPSGILSGVLFLISKKYLLPGKSITVQSIVFVFLIVILNFIFFKGDDLWSFV